jgi:hypothetical protein
VLKDDGTVYAMGDDTFGQCGQDDKTRNTHPPFVENRIKFPVQVVIIHLKSEKLEKYCKNRCRSQSQFGLGSWRQFVRLGLKFQHAAFPRRRVFSNERPIIVHIQANKDFEGS